MDNPVAKVLMDIMIELNGIASDLTHEADLTKNIELCCKVDGVIEAFRIVSMYCAKSIVEAGHDGCPHCAEAGGD